MKLMDVYFKELEDHQKIYGKDKSILLMQVGSFYEAYQTDNLGFDLKIISELTNFIITKRDKSNPITNIDNPFTLGFPLNSLNKYGYKHDDIITYILSTEEKYISFSKYILVDSYKIKDKKGKESIREVKFEIRFIDTLGFLPASIDAP